MKLNLTIKATKNYQTVEISATDIEVSKYVETKQWLIKEAQNAINEFVPGENTTQRVNTHQPAQRVKPVAPISQKQIDYLMKLGYNGDVLSLTASEASNLIDRIKSNRN